MEKLCDKFKYSACSSDGKCELFGGTIRCQCLGGETWKLISCVLINIHMRHIISGSERYSLIVGDGEREQFSRMWQDTKKNYATQIVFFFSINYL